MQTRDALFLFSFALGACALNTRPGDGLVSDELSQSHQFGTVAPPGEGMFETDVPLVPCKNSALFVQQVLPRFVERCVECHDGTKLKATIGFYLKDATSTDPTKQKNVCDLTLTMGVDADRLKSTILSEVDPTRPDLEHEFKFEDVASFAVYREAVMAWLMAE
jgi:hypothetical protein